MQYLTEAVWTFEAKLSQVTLSLFATIRCVQFTSTSVQHTPITLRMVETLPEKKSTLLNMTNTAFFI